MIQFLLTGGSVPPFVSYQPVTVTGGQEQATTAALKSGSSSDLTDKDFLKMIDKLEALPNDSQALISSLLNFYIDQAYSPNGGNNTSSLELRYLSAVGLMNNLKFYRKMYDEAYDIVKGNGGLNELAIAGNKLIAMNKDMDIKYISPSDAKDIPEGYQLLTNSNLLSLRANNPLLVGNTQIIDLVKNGIGMESVTKMIKDSMINLGTEENKTEGYARTDKNTLITALQDFLKAAKESGNYNATVDNLYKGSLLTKNLAEQADKALQYIYSTLPENAKTLLKTKTQSGSDEDAYKLVGTLINSGLSSTQQFSVDMDSASAAKVAAKRKESDDSNLKSNPILNMVEGNGGSGTVMQVDKGDGTRMSVNGTYYGQIKTVDGKPIQDTSLGTMIAESGIQSVINNTRNITFGDLKINPEQLNNITYNNTGLVRTNLPIKSDGSVDLSVIDNFNIAKAKIEALGSKATPEAKLKIFHEYKLDSYIKPNGLLNELNTAPFFVTEGYTTSSNGIKDSDFIKEVNNPDDSVINLIKKSLTVGTGDNALSPSIDEFSWWNPLDWFGYDKVYKAAIYIPITTNVNASLMGANDKIDFDESQNLEAQALTLRKRLNVNTNNSASILNNE